MFFSIIGNLYNICVLIFFLLNALFYIIIVVENRWRKSMKKKKQDLPTSGSILGEGLLENKKKTLGRTEKKILIVSAVGILLTLIIGASYAYIAYTTRQEGINVLETDCINVTMEELTNEIRLTNAYPITDEVGSNLKPFRFKLTNTCGVGVDYNINLEVMEIENRIAAKNIAVKVDGNAKSILSNNPEATPTYQESDYTAVESYTTYSGSIKPYESVEHEVRIWLDESAGNDSQNGKFYSKVVIEARQNQMATSNPIDYDAVQIGDYVAYTPSKKNFLVTQEMTGCSGTQNPENGDYNLTCNQNQSINPSELNLWRVIRKNDSDRTIEIVSENVSSNDIYFEGQKSFVNFIYGLNQIAASYETDGITKGSRHMGYDSTKATETLNNIKNLWANSAPWTTNTNSTNSPKGSDREIQGGGDYGFNTDIELVSIAYGGSGSCEQQVSCPSLMAKKINSDGTEGDYGSYWVASRAYHYYDNYYGSPRWDHMARFFGYSNNKDKLATTILLIKTSAGWRFASQGHSVRPIVILLPKIGAELGTKNGKNLWTISQ